MSECQIARYLNVYKMKNNKNMFAPDESLKVSGPKISILFPAQQTGAGGLKVSTAWRLIILQVFKCSSLCSNNY